MLPVSFGFLLLSVLFRCSTMVAAAPAASPQTLSKREASLFSRDTKLAADIVQTIMPKSASCTDAAAPDECSTASEAAPYLIQAMQDYKINTAPEIAAVLALVALESAELRYRRSISKNPGQGTSNMQQANFNAEYAASFPELSANLTAAGSDPDAILDLVTVDKYNFGSGPWFLVTHCSESVRVQLATTPDNGFAAYMKCIGTNMTPERLAYWGSAKKAFGL